MQTTSRNTAVIQHMCITKEGNKQFMFEKLQNFYCKVTEKTIPGST